MQWDEALMRAWLLTRPAKVKALAREFPIGTAIKVEASELYVFGYTEDDSLIVTPVWPPTEENYAEAMARRVRLCAAHVRDGSAR